jgi:shikimate dehydrogenase/3-dehydroquinate dehydratase type I
MDTNNPVRICIPLCERSLEALEVSASRATSEGDSVEFRLDCLPQSALDHIDKLLRLVARTDSLTVLTLRPSEEGGKRELDYGARDEFWRRLQDVPGSYLMDLELDLVEGLLTSDRSSSLAIDWARVIGSKHDFSGPPADVEQTYQRLAHTPVRIIKIAVQAHDATDCIPIFRLLKLAREEGREAIAIAMGPAGVATRILGPSRGAFLTYGALDKDASTAPGQITAQELRDVYRVRRVTSQTKILGLVGFPVTHSISPHIHNAAFDRTDFDGVYIPFEVRDLASFIKRMVHPRTREMGWNLRGLSVTAPHKSAVMDHLDWIEPAAKEIGAVNTVMVEEEVLRGYNTDAHAFIKTLIQRIGDLRDARCAIIGAGGAASALLWGLRQSGSRVTVYARDINKAEPLAERFGAQPASLDSALFEGFDVVINATPLGTSGKHETETPAHAGQLRGARLAYDLVYNPAETQFLREAQDAGCEILGGLSTLVAQAREQFRLWTGLEAPVDVMESAAVDALKTHQKP